MKKFIYEIIMIAVGLTLVSCAAIKEYNRKIPMPENGAMKIEVRQLHNQPLDVVGMQTFEGDTCVIYLRTYPRCLAHEIRHCYEGNWHGDKPSNIDCD